jgi:hypothetical protein
MNFLWIRHNLRFREFYNMSYEEQLLYLASAELEMEAEKEITENMRIGRR